MICYGWLKIVSGKRLPGQYGHLRKFVFSLDRTFIESKTRDCPCCKYNETKPTQCPFCGGSKKVTDTFKKMEVTVFRHDGFTRGNMRYRKNELVGMKMTLAADLLE